MSEPARRDEGRPGVPLPPAGHALRLQDGRTREPQRHAPREDSAAFPIFEETSAGGIVLTYIDGVPHAAVIARRNRGGRLEWCLPKGHLEGAETPPQAAIREISEETGIRGQILALLGVIDYWFTGTDRRVHKVVHHFMLAAVSGTLTVENDPDAEAEDVAWIPVDQLTQRLSYPNERRIAAIAQTRVQDHDVTSHYREGST
ncbi:NUDIX hydrolase [Rarobacter faecitabidus]|uniref:NUDIX domain-containing protein n=1 Tax=Rarobacter faecitabidus TaxID=13243 RepID=A0A542ZPE7_RARFA|nr:NUDIX hydrolase [Rarobacter faecitabidus]TQL62222.1 NUDIX domain-containing protein [Rarobacter faecitabidus]